MPQLIWTRRVHFLQMTDDLQTAPRTLDQLLASFEDQFGQSERAFTRAFSEVRRLCAALADRDAPAEPQLLGTPEFAAYLEQRAARLRTATDQTPAGPDSETP